MKRNIHYIIIGIVSLFLASSVSACQKIARKISKVAEVISADDTAESASEDSYDPSNGPAYIRTRDYKNEVYFKANISRELYADQSWEIRWPEKGINCNVKKLQTELVKFLAGDEYDDFNVFLKDLESKFFGEGEWTKVDKLGDTDAVFDEEDEYNPYQQSMNFALNEESRSDDGIVIFSKLVLYDTGTGLGAGIWPTYGYMMYDLKTDRRIAYEDIFKAGSEAAIADILRNKATNLDDYRTLIEAEFPPVHKDNFYLDYDKREAHFVYDKYEVAAGADGTVELIVPFDDIMEYMK